MIILINNEGQMCNRIKEFAHCIAYAIEKHEALINAAWGELDQYFEHGKCSIDVRVETNQSRSNSTGYIGRILTKFLGGGYL